MRIFPMLAPPAAVLGIVIGCHGPGHHRDDGCGGCGPRTVAVREEVPATPPPAAAAVEYYCPMHPQVVRAEPGTCPICEMPLDRRPVR